MKVSDTRLAEVFARVIESPPGEREAVLGRECAGDAMMEATVRELVAASERAGSTGGVARALNAETPEALAAGTRIGPYEIERVIATGGMGIVYCARDVNLDVRVALKAVKPAIASDARFRRKLRDEARTAARLSSHPNIATVHAFLDLDGQAFIVSQFIEGETLRQRLARGRFGPRDVIDIALAILDALSAAHAAGIVHRDLKPENVMRTPEGRIVVLDFGIALREAAVPDAATTLAGGAPGTIGYMSPEQLRGLPVDGRSDLFALGIVMYELLTGRHPFARQGALSSWGAVLLDLPTSLDPAAQSGWPAGLADVIEHALRKRPEDRFESAGMMAGMLAAVRDGRLPAASSAAAADAVPDAVFWWQVHEVTAAVVYWSLLIPVWLVRDWIPVMDWRLIFFPLLATLCIVPTLRLHLWFVLRVHPSRAPVHHARYWPWIRVGDAVFSLTLVGLGALLAPGHAGWAALFVAFGLGSAVVAAVIEPPTAEAALLALQDRRTGPTL